MSASTTTKRISVLFGSETGTAQEVAERIAHDLTILDASNHNTATKSSNSNSSNTSRKKVILLPLDATQISNWASDSDLIVFVVATAGNGDPPRTMRNTWRQLLLRSCPRLDGLHYAVFGLGDSTYPRFNFMAKMLHNRLERLGAVPVVHRALGDDEDPQGYETELRPFLNSLYASLGFTNFITVDDQNAAAVVAQSEDASKKLDLVSSIVPDTRLYQPLWHVQVERPSEQHQKIIESTPMDFYLRGGLGLQRFTATSVLRVTTSDHFQDVRHITLVQQQQQQQQQFDTSSSSNEATASSSYLPGDTFAMYPRCPQSAVAAMLRVCRLQPDDVITIVPNPRCRIEPSTVVVSASQCRSTSPTAATVVVGSAPLLGVPFRAVDLFSSVLDIQAATPRQFLWVLAGWCRSGASDVLVPAARTQRSNDSNADNTKEEEEDETFERLLQLSRLSMDDYMEYVTRERRPIYEVLEDFWPMLLLGSETAVAASAVADRVTGAIERGEPSSAGDFPGTRVPSNWLGVVISHLRPIAVRHFSICRFAGQQPQQQQPQQAAAPPPVELLIAIHKVTTPMKRQRTGLCSAYIEEELTASSASSGTTSSATVLGFIERGVHTLPTSDASAPMILVGPGTGIAPIRAVVQRRLQEHLQQQQQQAAAPPAPTFIFTGHRHPEKDFPFRDEWRDIASASDRNGVVISHSFSRYSAPSSTTTTKYVQHAITAPAMRSRLGPLLRDERCIVIVSGNAKQMPKDVYDALALCLTERGDDEEQVEAAEKHLDKMRQAGRYVVDAWA